ncbi:hypothetical protein ACLQ2R_30595 [Streptosporangium sp. DT93]|uniref:hypothetical protein n=1 Tax=Streptosporangium sp. DT93 TaxID=3393428 RepID=UPI003CED18C4
MTASWRPLRERVAAQAGERTLVESTPDYLLEPLQQWLAKMLFSSEEYDVEKMLRLRLRRRDIVSTEGGKKIVSLTGEDLLEAIDATLDLGKWRIDERPPGVEGIVFNYWVALVMDLNTMLKEGGSAWRVNDTLDGLTRRVDVMVTAAALSVIKDAPSDAAQHLRKAWGAAYGPQPDPTVAYSEAVKAVEAVVIPMTIPNDGIATLGKALAHMKSTQAKWNLAIDDKSGQPASLEAVIALIGLLWHGQRDRHAGPSMKPATQEAAQTALHAAVTLVQWFTSGAVRKQS